MPNASKKLEVKGMVVLELKREEAISQQVSLNYEIAPLTIKEKKDFYNAFYKQYKAGISFFGTLLKKSGEIFRFSGFFIA